MEVANKAIYFIAGRPDNLKDNSAIYGIREDLLLL